MSAVLEIPQRISVLDDEEDVVRSLERRLTRRGYAVQRVVPPTSQLADTLREVKRVSDAALCDHYLRGGHRVDFSGAQLVRALTEEGFPAVLFTGVLPAERWEIKRNLAHIPAFLPRDDEGGLSPDRVLGALAQSVAEVRTGEKTQRRRGRRTPVSVIGSRTSGNQRVLDVLVSGWPGPDPVPIPADILPPPWRGRPYDAVGKTFFAVVNIAEPNVDQLYFDQFEAEPAETERLLPNRSN